MKIKRIFTDNFFMMSNYAAQDANLSCAAKGLLAHLLSLPVDWEIHENELTRHCTDGKAAVHTAMKKLIQAGYVYKTGQRERTVYYVDTFPHTLEEWEKSLNNFQQPLSTAAENQQDPLPGNQESLCRKSDKGLSENQQSPLPKIGNDLTRNSANTNTYNNTNNKTYKKESAEAPDISLSQNFNPAQKDLMSRLEGIRKTWNDAGGLTPFRKIMFTPAEFQNICPTLQAYSDELIKQAICNYAVTRRKPQEYYIGVDHAITFVNFLTRWVERFTDEAKPFDRFKLKKQPAIASDKIEPGTKKYRTY